MRFERTNSALEQLADTLRRADLTWQWEDIHTWDDLTESEREEWLSLARSAASSAYEELSPADRRVRAD
jgi:hypothetical protein